MNATHNPEHELAMRLASYRQAVQDPDVFTRPVPTPDEQEEARRIAYSIRLSVKAENAARSARLTFIGLAWVVVGSIITVLFNVIFDVPLLVVVGSVMSIVGLLISVSALWVQRGEHQRERAKWDPRILALVVSERKAHDRARRAELAAKVRALPGRLHRGR